MRLCNETVTVYNARFDSTNDTDKYERTVITGTSWFNRINSTVDKNGLNAANQVTVRIPTDASFGGKSYTDPKSYAAAASVATLFTLNEGDIIVRGTATEMNPKPADLRKKYPETTTILSITDNRRARAPHWKVVGS